MTSLLLSVLLACAPESQEYATAFQLEDLGDGIGGPKALARTGDFILENDKMRFAILGARNSYGPGLYGGTLIDADIVRPGLAYRNGNGNDRFVELNPTVNLDIPLVTELDQVEIVETDDGSAIIRVTAIGTPYLGILLPLRGITPGSEPTVGMVTDYILRPGEPWLTLRTTTTIVPKSGGVEPLLDGTPMAGLDEPRDVVQIALGGGIAMGDFYQQGGAVDAFLSGIGFDESGAIYEANQAGRNLFWTPFSADLLGGTAEGVSYGIASTAGKIFTPLFASSQTVGIGGMTEIEDNESLNVGQSFTYERVFTVGNGDIGSVMDNVLLAKGVVTGEISGHVVEAASGDGVSGARVFVYEPGQEAPWSEWTTDVALDDINGDGSFGGTLPVGEWELMVHQHGRPQGERFALTVGSDPISLTLEIGKPGRVHFTITDETGEVVPSKVTILREDLPAERDPVLGDGYIGGNPEAVLFAPYGKGDAQLSPGDYRAIATRGPEYEMDEVYFTVTKNGVQHLDLQVIHSVDTSGWVGADLHVHGNPSFDSGVSATDRVMTMVSEGVEFMASTDHDFIFDYAPTIEDMNLNRWLQSSVGVEVTPLEMGHYIAFGVDHDFLSDAGGAFDWKGRTPGEILASLEGSGNGNIQQPVTFVAHPRDGILGYFDQYGFDPHGGNPGSGGQPGFPSIDIPLNSQVSDFTLFTEQNFTLEFDALELFNGKRLDFLRTPTDVEMAAHAENKSDTDAYNIMTRTLAEMDGLHDGTIGLGYGVEGQIDDWFTLLNLGFRHTALANSDTHGKTSIESGCPRNFVETGIDNPEFVDETDIAAAVRDHRVVASYGPFVRFWIDESGIGSELTGSGSRSLEIEAQSPSWMAVNHIELYENGTLIEEWNREKGTDAGQPWLVDTIIEPAEDSWYVVVASGPDSLFPLFTPVEIPPVELQDVVTEAVGAVLDDTSLLGIAVEHPKTYPMMPYALTNPIWIDLDDDGFDAPGIPAWQIAPEPPAEAEEEEGD